MFENVKKNQRRRQQRIMKNIVLKESEEGKTGTGKARKDRTGKEGENWARENATDERIGDRKRNGTNEIQARP